MKATDELLAILRRAQAHGIEPLRVVVALNADPSILHVINAERNQQPSSGGSSRDEEPA